MAEQYIIQDTTLTGIADKIRVLSGTEETMTPAEMAATLDTHNTEMNEVLSEQDSLIAQLAAALEGKTAASGGVEYEVITAPIGVDNVEYTLSRVTHIFGCVNAIEPFTAGQTIGFVGDKYMYVDEVVSSALSLASNNSSTFIGNSKVFFNEALQVPVTFVLINDPNADAISA